MIEWILIPQNAALLNLIGFALGVVGFILTIAGLWIALKQISQLKTEAEATTAAVRAVQFKVSNLDIAKECHSGMARIGEIRVSLKEQNWHSILSSYEALIEIFLRIAHSPGSVSPTDSQSIIKMTEDMAKICEGLRRNAADPENAKILKGQDQALRNFSDVMARLSLLAEKDLRA